VLKQRIITASILAALALWWIWSLESATLAVIFAVIFTLGGWEWSRLVGLQHPLSRIAYTALYPLGFALLFPLLVPGQGNWPQFILVLALMWWALALMSVLSFPRSALFWQGSRVARALAGLLVLAPSWAALLILHSRFDHGYFILLAFIIWGADTGAYFAGRAFGKRKLAPQVSPGKSWEGVIGGLLLALAVAGVATYWLEPVGGYPAFFMLVFVTVFISVLGDLMESLFKRVMNLKDSGGILPGHGGVLDRLDSLTAAAPLFTLGLLWLS
jgi:phosphatidate cytidylyltransferase